MLKIALGLVTALMLAACAYTGTQTAAAPSSPMTSGVGHPDQSYPGPRAY
jgi:hypothetical protein